MQALLSPRENSDSRKPDPRFGPNGLHRLAGIVLGFSIFSGFVPDVWAQPAGGRDDRNPNARAVQESQVPAAATGISPPQALSEQLRLELNRLSSASFRARQLARWRLEQHPREVIQLVQEMVTTTDVNTGEELISLLGDLAMSPDPSISVPAYDVLSSMANSQNRLTAVSFLASDVLDAIAERQELLALQRLEEMNVQVGPLQLSINSVIQNRTISSQSNILYITDTFRDNSNDIKVLQFLRSVDTAYVERAKVSDELMQSIVAMPNLKRLVLRGAGFENKHLRMLLNIHELQYLEIVYANVTDDCLDVLGQIPVARSLHIFGTKITSAGGDRLKKSLEDLDIFFSRGGFLGVTPYDENGLQISAVVRGSGAEQGGIRSGDLLTHVDSVPIKTFNELREQLTKHAVGETVMIQLERPRDGITLRPGSNETMTLPIILKDRPTEPISK